jgi:hypothetical protein
MTIAPPAEKPGRLAFPQFGAKALNLPWERLTSEKMQKAETMSAIRWSASLLPAIDTRSSA